MDLAMHYRNLFLKYGDSPQSAQWSDSNTQEKRFQILSEIADLRNCEILDFGCGTAHFATYLKNKKIPVSYTGVDIVQEFLECAAKKHPEFDFCDLDTALKRSYDYAFICGVFNNDMKDNRDFYKETIKQLFSVVRKGLSFNMLCKYVDYYDDGLFYESPENVFEYIKKEVSQFITIRNDYQIKPGVIPFEFTVYVYRR